MFITDTTEYDIYIKDDSSKCLSCNVGLYLNGSAPNYCINTTACSYAYDLSASPSPVCSSACSLLYQIPDNNKICTNCSSSCGIGNCSIGSILF